MVNVIVAQKKSIQLSTNAISGIVTTSIPIVLKNNSILSPIEPIPPTTLTQMTDIDFFNGVDGATLIYNQKNNQFILEPIPFIDGGQF